MEAPNACSFKSNEDIYQVKATDEELTKLAVQIGADVPYCLIGGTALCTGIGEIVKPLKPFKTIF